MTIWIMVKWFAKINWIQEWLKKVSIQWVLTRTDKKKEITISQLTSLTKTTITHHVICKIKLQPLKGMSRSARSSPRQLCLKLCLKCKPKAHAAQHATDHGQLRWALVKREKILISTLINVKRLMVYNCCLHTLRKSRKKSCITTAELKNNNGKKLRGTWWLQTDTYGSVRKSQWKIKCKLISTITKASKCTVKLLHKHA